MDKHPTWSSSLVCYQDLIKCRDLKFSLIDKSLNTKTAMTTFKCIVGRYKYLGIEKKIGKPESIFLQRSKIICG